MNGRERVEAVMRGTELDRVPVMCQLSMGHIIKNSGVPPAEFLINYYTIYAKTLAHLVKKYEFDGVLLDYPIGYNPEFLKTQVEKIVDNANGQLIVWKNGDETFCPVNDYPIQKPKVIPKNKPLIETDINDLPLLDGYKSRLSDLPEYYMEPFRGILDKIGKTHSVHGFVAAPLSLLAVSFGIEDILVGLIDHPDYCRSLLDALTGTCIIWVDNIVDIGVHAVCVTAPFEGAGFMSPNMYKEFGLPFTTRLVEHIKSRGVPSYVHMCGCINDRLEAIADTGVDGIECLDPAPIGDVNLEDAIKRIGDKVFIKGNIDPVNTLLLKKQSEIYQDAVERIKIASPTKRFILSSACSVSPDTPEENLMILVKAVEDFGYYKKES